MFELFSSATGTIRGKQFSTVAKAEKFARTLEFDTCIFKVDNPFKVVKWVFVK